MAETAVNLVTEKLIPLLVKEVKLQRDVHKQVRFIRKDLKTIQSFLRDVDARAGREDTSNEEKNWVKQVREEAHRIEDVIDEYLLQVANRSQGRRGFVSLLFRIGGCVKRIKPSHEIISQIGEIREQIERLKGEKASLSDEGAGGRRSSSGSGAINSLGDIHKLRALYIDDDQVAGINESPKENLLHCLLGDETTRTVIPVVGPGGLGKTTLVKRVYDDVRVKKFFPCQAWVTVSHSFKSEELLRDMIKQFYKKNESALKGIETMEKPELIDKAREYVKRKRYLVVFDDVWIADFWELIDVALPKNDEGSKIIITTRKQRVADNCQRFAPIRPFQLDPLQQEEALDLFYRKAFQFDKSRPENLKKLSLDIVNKCGRIPLAIVAIGGLLSTKNKVESEWQKVHDSLNSWSGNYQLSAFTSVLSESYYDLPYHLKFCLLYFGIFPEDYSISCKKLVRLWIAEGFVDEDPEKPLEEVAWEYLLELINRSLVQVSWRDFDGKPRSCGVHDLMHNFIFKKCEELNFCHVLKKTGNSSFNSTPFPRRLSIHDSNSIEKGTLESVAKSKIRSCFIFSPEVLQRSSINSLFSSCKLLKTLDFDDAPLDVLPEEVGNLLNLRYLSVRNTETKTLPRSIGKLHNLLTLDFKNSQLLELPEEINRLIKLRNLLGYSFHEQVDSSLDSLQGVKIKQGFGRLTSLRKLYSVDVSEGASIIKELRKLKQLKKLGITKLTKQNGRVLCSAIENMNNLSSLSIEAVNEQEFLDLQSLTPPQKLQRLYLEGRLENLPEWIPKLKSLVRIILNLSGLRNDPLEVLKELKDLLELGLDAYEGDELHFKEGWLQKLKILRLKNLPGLKTLRVYKKALPQLEKLYIGPCPQLVEMPNDIQNLEKLQALRFYDMPGEFRHSMDPNHGDYVKIKHVPSVLFFNKRGRGNRYYCNSLHYINDLKKKHGDDYEIGALFGPDFGEPRAPVPIRQEPYQTTDKWFWVTALMFSLFVFILVLLSEQFEDYHH